jgi:hypothetical protein
VTRVKQTGLIGWILLVAVIALGAYNFNEPLVVTQGLTVHGLARFYGGTDILRTRCINIDPTATITDWFFWRTDTPITVTHVNCEVDGATSTVLTLRTCDANGASCVATESAMTCATTNTPETGTIDSPAVGAGVWMRVQRGTVTGSPTQAVLCMSYTIP